MPFKNALLNQTAGLQMLTSNQPIPAAVRFKAWVCGHSRAGIAVSNPAGDIDVCLVWMLCVVW